MQIVSITGVCSKYIELVNGAYKPTNIYIYIDTSQDRLSLSKFVYICIYIYIQFYKHIHVAGPSYRIELFHRVIVHLPGTAGNSPAVIIGTVMGLPNDSSM